MIEGIIILSFSFASYLQKAFKHTNYRQESHKLPNKKEQKIYISYLGEMLNLTLDPKSKKSKKSNCKENKENRLNTENTTSFCNLNGTVVKCALVWMLIYFVDNCANKIKCSRLQKQE